MLDRLKALLNPNQTRQTGSVQGQYYERTGECHQCGQCCSNIYLVHGDQTIDSLELFEELKVQNPEYAYFKPIVKEGEEGVAFQCEHLQADQSCGIYERRPDFCRRYPSEHTLLMGGKLAEACGYRFRLLRSFQDVLRQNMPEPDSSPMAVSALTPPFNL